jgi:hypothetical protein
MPDDSKPPGTPKQRKRSNVLADAPQLAPIKDVAEKLGVTPAAIRKWSREGVFPEPHIVLGRMWFYRADHIEHKFRTGNWPAGVKLRGGYSG